MLQNHFYHKTCRKAVSIFGTIFNDINIVRSDASGNILEQLKVPLSYSSKAKFLARLEQDSGTEANMAIKLPRMGFEMLALDVDAAKKGQRRNEMAMVDPDNPDSKKVIRQITPYNIGFQLHIVSKTQDDALQILEQILPYFSPEYTLSINPISGQDFKEDVAVVLNSVSLADDYEGDFITRRSIIYTLDFQMKINFYGPVVDKSVIKTVEVDFSDFDNTSEFLEGLDFDVNPSTATENDSYSVDVTYREFE